MNCDFIEKKLQEETEICRQTLKYLKNIGNGCTALARELNNQLNSSLKTQELYKRVLSNRFQKDSPDQATKDSVTCNFILDQKNKCKSIIKRLKKALLHSLPQKEKFECSYKLRKFKQLLMLLNEILDELQNGPVKFISIYKWPISTYSDKVSVRIIGCENLSRSFPYDFIVTGFPGIIKESISNGFSIDHVDNSNAPVKCDLIINSHVIFSTVIHKPSHHCWNQTFEFPHDFNNPIELHVTWISPYLALDTLIKKTASHYENLDFVLAGISYLVFDEEQDQGFISRTVKLYPSGKLFMETFIKPKMKYKNRSNLKISRSISKSVISPSTVLTQSTNSVYKYNSASETFQKSDYKLVALLGTGHFGKIILCQNISNRQYFAIKALKKTDIISNNEYSQVLEEKKILQVITNSNHPFLVHMFCCLQDKKYIMFFLEFVQAGDLATLMHTMKCFTEIQTKFYASIIVLCIEFLHDNNIMYRDLKMENLLIDSQGYLKLVDFGLSKTNMNKISRTTTFCGTIDYIAPEVLIDDSYTRMVDWWTLGVMVYYMITGNVPFCAETDMESLNAIITRPIVLPPTTEVSLSSFILSLLDRNPYSRLGSQNGSCDIKNHFYFKNISFSKIYTKSILPPFVPHLQHSLDLSYFDRQFIEKKPTLSSAESVDVIGCIEESFFDNFCL